MKAFYVLLILIATSAAWANRIAIVQVDTGSLVSIQNAISLEKSGAIPWHEHGTDMARSLDDEASKQGLHHVTVAQLQWKEPSSVPEQIWAAIALNPKIISLSLAGDEFDEAEYLAIREASERGILVLAAAGNQGLTREQYPGAYRFPCMISVSTLRDGRRAESANPGEVYVPAFADETGTSYSTARLGAIALKVWRTHPKWSCARVKTFLVGKLALPASP